MPVFIGKVELLASIENFYLSCFPWEWEHGYWLFLVKLLPSIVGQFYFELIVLHVDDMCSMNHVCIKHIITDDKDNFNRYWHVKSIKHAEFSFRTGWSLHWKKLIFLHAFLNLIAEGNNFAGKEFPILLMIEVNS